MTSSSRHWLGSTALTVAPALLAFSIGDTAQALPKNGQVTAGDAQISTPQAKRLKIEQSSDRAVIDWQSFDIAVDEKVEIVQPGDHSSLLNRVIGGGDASRILGDLVANGRVVLVNPSGIDIDVTARIDVGGLIASTANIANRDFLDGRLNFDEPGAADARILNRGAITAAEGGLVALVAPGVENAGVITARLGRIALASGTRFTLDLYGDDLVRIAVDGAVMQRVLGLDGKALDALVSNSGSLSADGGLIQVSAAAADGVIDTLINMGGHVRAQTVAQIDGEIVLGGRGGAVIASAEIDASGAEAGERGGTVKVLGDRVGLANGARIDASGDAGGGEVLIGGNFQGLGPEPNATHTVLARDVEIDVSARRQGDGGRAIVWADEATRYYASIMAEGGPDGGDGGLVEVSGKRNLVFRGDVSTAAPKGDIGSLLLDPDAITVANGSGGADDAQVTGDGAIAFADGGTNNFTISEEALENIAAGTNITLQANNSITINDLSDNSLDLNQTGSVSFQTGAGGFSMNTGDSIVMSGVSGNFSIDATAGTGSGNITLGGLSMNGGTVALTGVTIATQAISGGSTLNITASNGVTLNGAVGTDDAITINADSDGTTGGTFTIAATGSLTSTDDQISITADDVSIDMAASVNAGTALVILEPGDSGGTIQVGTAASGNFSVDDQELQRITAGSLRIGDDESGKLTVTGVTTADLTNISGALILRSGADLLIDDNAGTAHTFKTLSLFAKNGVTLESDSGNSSNFTTTGALTIDADSDDNGAGTLALNDDTSINSNNNPISIVANDMNLTSGAVLNAGTSSITISVSDGGTIGLGSAQGMTLDAFELPRITTTTLQFGTQADAASGITASNVDTAGEFANISGAITLRAQTGAVTFTGTNSTPGALTLEGKTGVNINGGVTASGNIIIDADIDDDGSGDLSIANSITLTSTGNITAILADYAGNTSGSITASSGTVEIRASQTAKTFQLGTAEIGDIGFGNTELSNITATSLVIGATSGDTNGSIFAAGVTAAATANLSSLTLNAYTSEADVNLSGANVVTNTFTVNAVDRIAVSGDQTTNAGALTLNADANSGGDTNNDITLTAGTALTGAGGVVLTASGGITGAGATTLNAGDGGVTLNNTLTNTSGSVTVDADTDNDGDGTLTIVDGAQLNGSGQTVTVTAADIALGGTSGTRIHGATLTIRSSDNSGINLGGGGASINLSDTELARLLALTTNFGDASDAVTVTVDTVSDADAENLGAVNIDTTKSVTFTGASQFDSLNVDADNGVIVNGNLTTDSGNLDLNGDQDSAADGTDSITFAAGVSLTAGGGRVQLTAPTSGFTAAGSLTLTGTNGVVLDDPLTLSGSLSINADSDASGSGSFTNASGAVVNTQNNNATIQTAGPTFGATLNVGTGTLTLLASTTGTPIGLGEELELGFSLNNTALGKVTANEFIVGAVSGTTNATIQLSGITSAVTSNIGTLTLNAFTAGADISFTGSASDINGNLNLNATDKIDVGQALTVGGALTFSATNQGTLTDDLTVANGITFNVDMAASGNVALDSDSNDDGSGNFVIADGKQLSNTTSSITVTAADVDLGGTSGSRISSAGSVTFFSSDNSGINLGAAGSSINLSNTELARITAANLTFGSDSANAPIVVSGISTTDLAGISGNFSVGSAASTTFSGTASSFKSLSTGEGGPVNVNVDLSTTTGDLSLSGNGINFAAGVSLSSAGNMTIDSGGSSGSASGALTLQAAGDLTINQNLTASGAVVLKADSDASGAGQFQVGSGATVTSNNNALSVTATTIDLDGSLNAGTGVISLLTARTDTTIGLGRGGGTFQLNGGELGRLTAGNLVIGGTSAGTTNSTIQIDDLSGGTHLANIAGAVNLNAITDGADIDVVSASEISAATFNAEDNITFSANLTAGGTLVLSADADGDGTGGVTVQSGATVTSSNNDLTVSASSLDLSGTVNAGTGTFVLSNPTGTLVIGTGGFAGSNFANVTAAGVNLGGGLASTVRIAGVAESDFASFDSTVAISAAAAGGVVSFETAASTFERLSVSASRIDIGTDVATTQADLSLSGPVQLTGAASLSSGNSTLQFSSTVDGAFGLTLNSGGGSLIAGGALGGTTALASLTATGASTSFSGVTTSGAQTYNGALTAAGSFTSTGGALSFNNTVTASGDSTLSSGGGAISFNGTLDGAHALTLNAGTGAIAFNQNVGATTRLGALTIESAGSVDVGGTLKSGAFTVTSASGTVDLGFASLDADGDVSITASQIEGKITGKALTLKTTGAGAGVNQALQIFVDSLDLDSIAAALEGLIAGSASPGAEVLSANLSVGGPLTFNAQDLAILINGVDPSAATTQNLAVEVATNQVESVVAESESEVLSDDNGGGEELDEVLDSVAADGGGTGGDGLVEVIGSDEIADVDDEEDEDQEGGCGCG